MKHLLIPFSLLIFLGVAVFIDYQKNNIPMIRPDPTHPVYTISSRITSYNVCYTKLLRSSGIISASSFNKEENPHDRSN